MPASQTEAHSRAHEQNPMAANTELDERIGYQHRAGQP